MKEQATDLISAVKEEGITATLDSGVLTPLITEVAKQLTTEQASLLIGSIFGALAPRVNGVILSYKQNRFERNIKVMVDALTARVEALERNLSSLSSEMQEQYSTTYVEMLLDNIVDERQEAKIKWNVNGFINLMTDESNENIMQLFFNTLSELTVLDVDVLRMYEFRSDINWYDIEEKYGVDSDQLKMVKEKLVRTGLLSRKNDEIRDNNLDEIIEYLHKLEDNSKKSKPKDIKMPSKIKKIARSESYKITRLGNGFLTSIGE